MIAFKKFKGLKPVTKFFKIAAELESVRNNIMYNNYTDLRDLRVYYEYLTKLNEEKYTVDIKAIIDSTDKRKLLELSHLLYHKIKEDFGYSVSENNFIKSSKDRISSEFENTELLIILDNLRSAFNVGSIFRTAECFSIKEILTTGITPGVENDRVKKTSKGTIELVDYSHIEDIESRIDELKMSGYRIIAAETGEGSYLLSDFKFTKRTAIIFGNEEIGIRTDLLKLCDEIVSIEMRGLKNSLNVSNAVSIFVNKYTEQFPNCMKKTD